MRNRLAAVLVTAAFLCACTGPKAAATYIGPMNSPVSMAGQPGQVPLDDAQRAEVAATAAKVPPAQRARLRYALATGDDGQRHLVVYDGEGLDAGGHGAKRHEYVVFLVLNANNGEHYDPQQNSIIAPIPPPPERDNVPTKP
jgi:hypothetical protein